MLYLLVLSTMATAPTFMHTNSHPLKSPNSAGASQLAMATLAAAVHPAENLP
jgi:hypothetical protein